MIVNANFTANEVSIEHIFKLIGKEDVENISADEQKKIISFILNFYKTCKSFTIKEIENLKNFLKLVINKFKEGKNSFFEDLLLINFENASSSFINAKVNDDTSSYTDHVRQYFLSIFDLGVYLKGRESKPHHIIRAVVNYLRLFLLNALKMIRSNYCAKFYCQIISEGNILETLNNFYSNNEIADTVIIYCFLLLTGHKEFDKDVIKCRILKEFTSPLISSNVITKNYYLILQILINLISRNGKNMKFLINNDEVVLLNNIVEKIYNHVKKGIFDFTCVNLLKLFAYLVEGRSNIIDSLLTACENEHLTRYEQKQEERKKQQKEQPTQDLYISFFENTNKIVDCVECLIKADKICNVIKDKGDLFYDFLCILFCVLKSILDVILSLRVSKIGKSESDIYSIERKKKEINEQREELLIRSILNLSLNFLVHNSYVLPGEKKMLHLLCMDVVIGVSSSYYSELLNHKNVLVRVIAEMDKVKERGDEYNNYLYVKFFEIIFYMSVHNEQVCKEYFNKEFILQVENKIYQLDKIRNSEDLKEREGMNSLKIYYFGIIYIYIKLNLEIKEKDFLVPFVNYVILKELTEKSFLLQNELYYLLFLQFLNISFLCNLYDFKKFVQNDSFVDLMKVCRGSTLRVKTSILNLLLRWLERKDFSDTLKWHVRKNKLIFTILFEYWRIVQATEEGTDLPSLDAPEEHTNERYMIYEIFKILTNNFTKYLNYFCENDEILNIFKCIILFEEKNILGIYASIDEQIEVLESDQSKLRNKIKLYNEKIEHIERRLLTIVELNYEKEVKDLESYYNSVRGER
ncbi:conserved Plasmodium protein, unknown function [Plasmodium malariae]|uniref:Uncharacterized protein n=1 Tax=Plasmodium malariae TaxID=5858 RepID=A0A1C3KD75_PLAMA|nr:conserved Plasmodium protein, unknown function [Plasmodium malariae]